MEIVIEIPKEEYQTYINHTETILDKSISLVNQDLLIAVINGTPLPKGHGDLIDVNVLKNNIHYVPLAPIFQGDYVIYRNVIFADILDMLPTIIEGSDDE